MECQRCHKDFSTIVAENNVETYGDTKVVACPHCGQAYSVRRIIQIGIKPCIVDAEEDDWGRKIKHYKKPLIDITG